jgi:hypothetical protein
VEHFSAARMANDYLKLYEKVLSGHDLHDYAPQLVEAVSGKYLSMRE